MVGEWFFIRWIGIWINLVVYCEEKEGRDGWVGFLCYNWVCGRGGSKLFRVSRVLGGWKIMVRVIVG